MMFLWQDFDSPFIPKIWILLSFSRKILILHFILVTFTFLHHVVSFLLAWMNFEPIWKVFCGFGDIEKYKTAAVFKIEQQDNSVMLTI